MEKRYISIGLQDLTKEELTHITRPLNNYSFKPGGGIWATEFLNNGLSLCEWLTHLDENSNYDRLLGSKTGVILNLKEEARVLILDSEEKLQQLEKAYPSTHHPKSYYNQKELKKHLALDYEKLSEDFDGIFIDIYNLEAKRRKGINYDVAEFGDFDVRSLVLFNLDCVKFYQTINLEKDKLGKYKIKNQSEEKKVGEITELYKSLELLIRNIAQDIFPSSFVEEGKSYIQYLEKTNKFYEKINKYVFSLKPKELKQMVKVYGAEKTNRIVTAITNNLFREQIIRDEYLFSNLDLNVETTPVSL